MQAWHCWLGPWSVCRHQAVPVCQGRLPTSIQISIACLVMQHGLWVHAGKAVTLHWYKHDFIVLSVLPHVKLACGLQALICLRKY